MTSPRRLFAPVDVASIAVFRIAFGAAVLLEALRHFAGGWIQTRYVDPAMHFKHYGFEWIAPWSATGMQVHFVVLAIAAAGVLLGLLYRLSALVLWLALSYVAMLDQTYYDDHTYLACLLAFLLIFVPAHRAWSVDARLRPSPRGDTVPALALWLLRGQIAIVYAFAIVAMIAARRLDASLLSAPLLAGTTLFLPAGWPRRLLRASPAAPGATGPPPPGLLPLVVIYLLVQVLVPLRHLLYPGPVDWTQEGARFAWRMRFAERSGTARFTVVDTARDRSRSVDTSAYLTPAQTETMTTRPDMVLQFCHYLAAVHEEQGYVGIEVHARVEVSQGDAPARPLVDPDVDLARAPRNLSPADWILR